LSKQLIVAIQKSKVFAQQTLRFQLSQRTERDANESTEIRS
jgi:hypothetical protein